MSLFSNPLVKKYLIIVSVIILGLVLAGCVGLTPHFTYQGVLTDASGNPYNGQVDITYRIFNSETGGTALYTQNETVTVTDGRFESVVGPSALVGGLEPADLAQALWIEMEIDNGTYDEVLEPRQRLYGAPYAFTLMPGAVISSSLPNYFEANGLNAILTVQNEQTVDPIPALRVVGEQGIELVNLTSPPIGSIYSDMDAASSDIYLIPNDNLNVYLNNDGSVETGSLYIYGYPLTNNCYFANGEDFYCTGTKSSVAEAGGEQRALYALESPGVWFEDFGSAQLVNGQAVVVVDSLFADTVNLQAEYHVFLTPLGDCNGLYVSNKTATGFEVHELGGGNSNVSFDYRIVAKRAGYEDIRMEVAPTDPDVEGQ